MFYNGYPEWTANSDWKLLLNLPCIHFVGNLKSTTVNHIKSKLEMQYEKKVKQ